MDTLHQQVIRGYVFQEQVGLGGFGTIYRAYQEAVDRDVAIKVIRPEHAGNPDFARRFESEARLVAQLEHPYIVPLYDFWQDAQGAFLVMRFLKGGTLRDVLDKQGALSLSQITRILNQIGQALNVAHQAGVIHRDLKPENILLDERGNAYLTDFGIAKSIATNQNQSEEGTLAGTIAYASPEQIQSTELSPASDIYSLGVVLFEMLVGEHPFAGVPVGTMVVSHLQETFPSIRDQRPDLPAELDDIIQVASAKAPAERYPDADSLARAFRNGTQVQRDAAPVSDKAARPRSQPDTIAGRNRLNMLRNVESFWIEGVLENSVHNATLLELGLKEQQQAVSTPWGAVLRRPEQDDEILPPDTQIRDVFDSLNGKMLILGDPGSGKTTTMLTLARGLLARAQRDEAHAIPVVFNLSSWSENRRPLVEWLRDELKNKYQVPSRVAQEWVDSDALLLFLDGLDEVHPAARDACVQAINRYRTEHGFVDMVVCSRTVDYDALGQQLNLNGAVEIQPLSDAQVNIYLDSLNTDTAPIRSLLSRDEHFQTMSHNPLMLSIMALAFSEAGETVTLSAGSLEEQRHRLFDVYARQMFQRRIGEQAYTPDETTRLLTWLARGMREHSQSMFLIEKLQPSWLPVGKITGAFRSVRRLHIIATMLVYSLPALLVPVASGLSPWVWALTLGCCGVVVGYVYSSNLYQSLAMNAILALAFGLAYGIGLGMVFGLVPGILFAFLTGGYSMLVAATYSMKMGLRFGLDQENIVGVEQLRFSPADIIPSLGIRAAILWPLATAAFVFSLDPGNLLSTRAITGYVLAALFTGTSVTLSTGYVSDEVGARVQPNHGIRASLRNATLLWGLSLIGLALSSIVAVGIATTFALGLAMWFIQSGSYGYGFFAMFGGINVTQHAGLRLFMWREQGIPLNLTAFLDHSVSLIFLRRVGGGYVFIHRYLLEYFAAQR